VPKPTEFHTAFRRALDGVSPRAVTVERTGSTNDDARALGREGAPHLTVVVAQEQLAGRGRLGRTWHAATGESLLCSWVVRPEMPVERWTLLPLLAGLAAAEAVEARAKVSADLKWPNDLLVRERKLGGILTEAELPDFAVIGLGLNVSTMAFPPELVATSLGLEGAVRLDRADLLAHILAGFDAALADPDAALDRYRGRCVTIGQRVRVERSDGRTIIGQARAVVETGALDVDGEQVAAGDVHHVRSDDET
jgi:BirA family biotin operon repressor/biotin-[acetyl-CoA-carboxylase] ligase